MKKLFFIMMSVMLFAGYSMADQRQWMTKAEAEYAASFLRKNKNVVSFCGCCDAPYNSKNRIKIKTVTVQYTGYDDRYEVIVEGKDLDSKQMVTEAVDLAYIHFKKGKMVYNVGLELGFDVDPCTEPFLWKEKKAKK